MKNIFRQKFKLLLIICLCFSSICQVGCTPIVYRYAKKTSNSYEIRVHLKTAKFPLNIPLKNVKLCDAITHTPIKLHGDSITIVANENGFNIDNRLYKHSVEIVATRTYPITLNGKQYFGKIKLIAGLNPTVINYIPIETYLLSVLPSEVPATFHPNALRAQCVIARTYSYYFMIKNHDEAFDVDDTTSFQVYNGFEQLTENKTARQVFSAIAATKNVVIVYENAPIVAYFHANSGGYTKSGLEYFGSKSDFPYLTAHEDPYSIDQPAYKWEYSLKKADFIKLFGAEYSVNQTDFCKNIVSGTKTFDTKTIRRLIGYGKVKSETFKITDTRENVDFVGYGYGHGVGMSQWGANNMAKQHFDFKQIIQFYYPGTELTKF